MLKNSMLTKLLLIPVFLLITSTCFSSGIMTISGKLTSITDTLYLVETQQSVFYIEKSAISPSVAATLDKTNVPVSLTVPMDAITLIKSKKKS
jgi:hypothetical protein